MLGVEKEESMSGELVEEEDCASQSYDKHPKDYSFCLPCEFFVLFAAISLNLELCQINLLACFVVHSLSFLSFPVESIQLHL